MAYSSSRAIHPQLVHVNARCNAQGLFEIIDEIFLGHAYDLGQLPDAERLVKMMRDAFLELLCEVTMDGVKPLPVGEMPRGILGMQELVLDTHELTAEAVVEGSREKLRRAMLTDPLVHSIADADQIIQELLELEKAVIPGHWYSPER